MWLVATMEDRAVLQIRKDSSTDYWKAPAWDKIPAARMFVDPCWSAVQRLKSWAKGLSHSLLHSNFLWPAFPRILMEAMLPWCRLQAQRTPESALQLCRLIKVLPEVWSSRKQPEKKKRWGPRKEGETVSFMTKTKRAGDYFWCVSLSLELKITG